jgi:hypothetical protein
VFSAPQNALCRDQFGAAKFVVLQMQGNLADNHIALALTSLRYVFGAE